MSDSDDDLLALAEVGSEVESDSISQPVKDDSSDEDDDDDNIQSRRTIKSRSSSSTASSNDGVLYPLENKYKNAEDRAKLLALPEIEREQILYDRAQEVQKHAERKYLADRMQKMSKMSKMARSAGDESTPSAKRQRGTTGVSSGTKSSLEMLKKRRAQIKRRPGVRGVDDSDDEESDEDESQDESAEESDGYSQDSGSESDVYASEEEKDTLSKQQITLSDANKLRWGRDLFGRYAQYPDFEHYVQNCFVRVNIGTNRRGEVVYRMGVVKRVVSAKPYDLNGRTVDEALVVAAGSSERQVGFHICSNAPISSSEFEYWLNTMKEAKLPVMSRRRAEQKFREIRELSKKKLTSAEIDELVTRRAKLNGIRGAGAVLVKSDLVHQREIAKASGDAQMVSEITKKLDKYQVNTASSSESSSILTKVNERNRRANVETVRRAEIQHNVERRNKKGTTSDPFSRLKTTAKMFYDSNGKVQLETDVSAEPELSIESTPLDAVDDLIASLDIKLDIVI
ncbi:Rtf1 protein [Starmerella bacillaris]|uniref:Rtf1 protein n=1 Tax=Starmerella bacillaris TaxID=1247836 RepID=A0AAV5RQP2_STABA|nr:Rtf1 protein [Starmerella bacillaris]